MSVGDLLRDQLSLVDHHVHGAFRTPVDRIAFEQSINEGSPEPPPAWMTQFDSQIGFAIRAHCAPLLDLEPHASAEAYWARREFLGEWEITKRFLHAAGVSDWLVDTGYLGDQILDLDAMADASGGRTHEIVRVESLAEALVRDGTTPSEYPEALRAALRDQAATAAGLKSVIAYRSGFDIDWTMPEQHQVIAAAQRWLEASGTQPRLTDPTLLCFGVHAALELGLPLQFHTGFGDRDLDLHRVNPILLLDLLRQPTVTSPIMLLHCYPYHREAGYLAQAFANVYCDVGLALNYVGARATVVLAESLELAPFAKILYSSDAWGPAELHYLGARLWRQGLTSVLDRWVDAGEWGRDDAVRVARLLSAENARRVYGIS
jgi:predicted TIM-barrel fold metal-dependent hydrolase